MHKQKDKRRTTLISNKTTRRMGLKPSPSRSVHMRHIQIGFVNLNTYWYIQVETLKLKSAPMINIITIFIYGQYYKSFPRCQPIIMSRISKRMSLIALL